MSGYNICLHGSWLLVSFEIEQQDSMMRTQPFGAKPNGACVFNADGRMMVLITAQGREQGNTDEKQSALLSTMMAYTGRYKDKGNRLIIQIDACWNEAWNSSVQERFYNIDGDTLEIISAWMPNPLMSENQLARGILSFRRESAS